VRDSRDRIVASIVPNYRVWVKSDSKLAANMAGEKRSTPFNTAAVYLAVRQDLCVMERLGIRVTNDGMTVVDPQPKQINAATSWKDLGGAEPAIHAKIPQHLLRKRWDRRQPRVRSPGFSRSEPPKGGTTNILRVVHPAVSSVTARKWSIKRHPKENSLSVLVPFHNREDGVRSLPVVRGAPQIGG